MDKSDEAGVINTVGGQIADQIVVNGTRRTAVDYVGIAALNDRIGRSIDGLYGRGSVTIEDIPAGGGNRSNGAYGVNMNLLNTLSLGAFAGGGTPYVSPGLIEAHSNISHPFLDFASGALRFGASNTDGFLSNALGLSAAGLEGFELGGKRVADGIINIFANPVQTLQGLSLMGMAVTGNSAAQGIIAAGVAQSIGGRLSLYGNSYAYGDVEGLIRLGVSDGTALTGEFALGKGIGSGAMAVSKARLFDVGTLNFAIDSDYAAFGAVNVKIHGNSKLSLKTAYLYELYDSDDTFLKYGITQHKDVGKRYTKSFLHGKDIFPINSGARADMLLLERQLVTQNPGILNMEPWAKAARAAGRGQ